MFILINAILNICNIKALTRRKAAVIVEPDTLTAAFRLVSGCALISI